MPELTVAALRRQGTVQTAERFRAGPAWADNDLVFATSLGTPIEPRNLSRFFHSPSVRERAGLGDVRLHDLRHTCITLLLSMGTPPHIVQAIAGHSHIDVTMTIYAHSALEDQTRALRGLGEALGRAG
jgi:integrase